EFQETMAAPVERHQDPQARRRLRSVVAPFLLRRLKTDPNILSDLPPKNEMKVFCSLSAEQASLYQAVLDEELSAVGTAVGIQRRGRVLALLTKLKQILNHPAQFLRQRGPLVARSGKLARMEEMLEEVLQAGDRALIFTQFREMGDLIQLRLSEV